MDIPLNGNILGVTISVGGACFGGGDGAVTRFSMLSIADQAIYQSKKSGRNTVTIKSVA
jgi:GGDEF domain-containing protein